ncbi:MAG TPA: hypothetical protein PLO69_14290 [Gammaproteobacteria bacterium]|nr:hypothetical protein [Gammaproteobacteria bacterium]
MSEQFVQRFVGSEQSEVQWCWKLWLIFTLFFSFCGLLLQLVVIPYGFPHLDAGHGLLAGGDWVGFQRLAVKMAARIQVDGWAAWQLRPGGQAPAGIAAAFYSVFGAKPYELVPLYAATYASDLVAVTAIYRYIGFGRFESLAGITPAVVFPSTLMMYGTLNKDAFFGAGCMMVLLGWVKLLGVLRAPKLQFGTLFGIFVLFVIGTGLVWLVRPYGVPILEASGVVVASVLLLAVALATRTMTWRDRSRAVGVGVIVCVALLLGMHYVADISTSGVTSAEISGPKVSGPKVSGPKFAASKIFGAISNVRGEFVENYPHAASMIDVHVRFSDVWDVLRYVPRAVQIAFLAPFPDTWFEKGSAASSQLMRRDAAFEMTLAYFVLIFGGLAVVKHGFTRRPEFWIVIFYCAVIIGVYVLAVPNVGSLFRFRQPLYLCVLGLGVAALVRELKSRGRRSGCFRQGRTRRGGP